MRRQPSQSSHSSTAYKRLPAQHTAGAANNNQTMLPTDAIPMQCLDVGSLLKFNERRDYRRLQCDSITDGTVSLIGSSLDLEWEHEYGERHDGGDDHRQLPASWHCSQNSSSSSSSEADGGCEQSIELSQMSSANARQLYQPFPAKAGSRNRRKVPSLSRPASATHLDGDNRSRGNPSWSHISTPDSLEWDVHEDERKFMSEEDSLDRETLELLNEIERLKNSALLETSGAAERSASCTGDS